MWALTESQEILRQPRQAIGEKGPREDRDWYVGRGNSENLLVGNGGLGFGARIQIEITRSVDAKNQRHIFRKHVRIERRGVRLG